MFAAFDHDLLFYWCSERDAKHSSNLRANPSIMIVVFDSTTPDQSGAGVYVSAVAEELRDPALIELGLGLIASRRRHRPLPVDDFVDGQPQRVYRARPRAMWTNVLRTRGQHYVDSSLALTPDDLT